MNCFRDTRVRTGTMCLLFALFPLFVVGAQRARFDAGLTAFGEGEYEDAIEAFTAVVAAEGHLEADGQFWLGRTHLALNRYGRADEAFRRFAEGFPEHPDQEEAQYQRARIAYLEAEYERAVVRFNRFLEQWPDSDFTGNALYWSGESLVALGRYDEARSLFRRVVTDYPRSFRFEAARYRLDLIDLSRRERQLLELLRWSNEEQLRLADELRRTRRASEQALESYRSQISRIEAKDGDAAAREELDERLEAVRLREEAIELLESLQQEGAEQ